MRSLGVRVPSSAPESLHDPAFADRVGHTQKVKRTALSLVAVFMVLFMGTVASAHDPIILTDDQTAPESGPFLPDGTISFALYGSFAAAGETRGLRAQFVDGDRLHVSLLIPDLAPENALSDGELPRLEIVGPDGERTELIPDLRREFAEPFTGTNYIELIDLVDTARTGIYSITVIGGAASRFTVSVGDKETFGTPVEGVTDRAAGIGGVMEWYAGGKPTDVVEAIPATDTASESVEQAQTDIVKEEQATSDDASKAGLRVAIVAVLVALLFGARRISRRILSRRRGDAISRTGPRAKVLE